jgi:hypothetical protein
MLKILLAPEVGEAIVKASFGNLEIDGTRFLRK